MDKSLLGMSCEMKETAVSWVLRSKQACSYLLPREWGQALLDILEACHPRNASLSQKGLDSNLLWVLFLLQRSVGLFLRVLLILKVSLQKLIIIHLKLTFKFNLGVTQLMVDCFKLSAVLVGLFLFICLKKVWKVVIYKKANDKNFFEAYKRIYGWFKGKKVYNSIKYRE